LLLDIVKEKQEALYRPTHVQLDFIMFSQVKLECR